MNILSLQKNVPTACTSQLFRAPWSCREGDPEEPELSFITTADKWILLINETSFHLVGGKIDGFIGFSFILTHLPSFS